MRLIAVITVFALLGLAPAAQSQDASLSFNLFSYEGAYLNKIFRFNADYTAKYNIPIDVPFALQIPIRKDVELIADGRPSGGIVKFTFATKDPSGRKFIENFHVVDASTTSRYTGTNSTSLRGEGSAHSAQLWWCVCVCVCVQV